MPAVPVVVVASLVVEVHGALGDDLLSVGALHHGGEVMGSVISGAQLVPGDNRGPGVGGYRHLVCSGRAVTLHIGEGDVGRGGPRVLYAEVGIESRAACPFSEVEGGRG